MAVKLVQIIDCLHSILHPVLLQTHLNTYFPIQSYRDNQHVFPRLMVPCPFAAAVHVMLEEEQSTRLVILYCSLSSRGNSRQKWRELLYVSFRYLHAATQDPKNIASVSVAPYECK
jgi:hypothetical protein